MFTLKLELHWKLLQAWTNVLNQRPAPADIVRCTERAIYFEYRHRWNRFKTRHDTDIFRLSFLVPRPSTHRIHVRKLGLPNNAYVPRYVMVCRKYILDVFRPVFPGEDLVWPGELFNNKTSSSCVCCHHANKSLRTQQNQKTGKTQQL